MSNYIEKYRDRTRQSRDDAFQRFMGDPMTRFAMSTIPAGDHQDALRMLLRASFEAGASCGEGAVAVELVEQMIKRKDKDR